MNLPRNQGTEQLESLQKHAIKVKKSHLFLLCIHCFRTLGKPRHWQPGRHQTKGLMSSTTAVYAFIINPCTFASRTLQKQPEMTKPVVFCRM